jgi:hypothetical protein
MGRVKVDIYSLIPIAGHNPNPTCEYKLPPVDEMV